MSNDQPWADKKLTEKQRADMAFRYQDWLLTKNVPSGGFRLLYAITQCLNEKNQFHCRPSLDYLAARIRRQPQTVWEMLPKLETLGVIEIEWGSQGSGNSNKYTLPAEFLEFYFGPEKGRLPKLVVPKKPRRAEVSKPRRAEVSDPLENSGSTGGKLRFAPEKTSASLSEPLIATVRHKKESGSAARSARVDGDRSNNSNDAPPSQRADALGDPIVAQQQPLSASPPTRPSTPPAPPMRRAAARADHADDFESIKRLWPPSQVGDKDAAYRLFCTVVRGRGLSDVMEAVHAVLIGSAEVPSLVEALRIASSRLGGRRGTDTCDQPRGARP